MATDLTKGITIHWLKPKAARDYENLVEGIDFKIINPNAPCPVTGGIPVSFAGVPDAENYEWLVKPDGKHVGVDYRLYKENEAKRPTKTACADYPNYNMYITEYGIVRRSDIELIAAIRQMETMANLSVQGEADKNKMAMMSPAVYLAQSQNIPLTPDLQAVQDRLIEVANKANQNAANAASLIAVVEASGIPDLDSGWEYDNITPQGFPFNA
jgi:hypothetical protein